MGEMLLAGSPKESRYVIWPRLSHRRFSLIVFFCSSRSLGHAREMARYGVCGPAGLLRHLPACVENGRERAAIWVDDLDPPPLQGIPGSGLYAHGGHPREDRVRSSRSAAKGDALNPSHRLPSALSHLRFSSFTAFLTLGPPPSVLVRFPFRLHGRFIRACVPFFHPF